jgi:hypothetical protein
MRLVTTLGLLLACAALLAAPDARAGTGPETTVVVVNADSPVSLRVAREYARGRGIPANHLVHLDGVPTLRVVDLPTFRERLWGPVKRALVERGLFDDVDVIAWSADFPFAVDVAAEAKEKNVQGLQHVPFRASLTGLTYLWARVEAGLAREYLDLTINRYFRRDGATGGAVGGGLSRPLTEAETGLAQQAQRAIQARDYTAARDAYQALVATAPELFGAWYDLACCHARLGALDAAVQALTTAVERGWSNAQHTLDDPDLEPLRVLGSFQALVERLQQRALEGPSSQGFRGAAHWRRDGTPDPEPAAGSTDRYLASVMLGVTGEWGNSADEVLQCLARSGGVDGTRPTGTVYLLANDDVRANTREPFFGGAVAALERQGRKAQVLTKGEDGQDGNVPKGKVDVLGAVMGTSAFTWEGNGSTLLPGAIAEHLTSFGADFTHGSQTKLSELIRAGAAGSSGTVAEPLALWQKFPVPSIHVHYARGCSLAEAFYQSLAGPWQTLVVGDPLARPFAAFAKVELATPPVGAPLAGRALLRARVEPAPGTTTAHVELWVDGRKRDQALPDRDLTWDTTTDPDGPHEVRLVAVEASPLATRSSTTFALTTSNAGRSVTLVGPKKAPTWGAEVVVTGKALGAATVDLLDGARVLASAPVRGGAFEVRFSSRLLGPGEARLTSHARFADGPGAVSEPLVLVVGAEPAGAKPLKPPKPPQKGKPAPSATAGLRLVAVDEKKKEHVGVLAALSDEALTKALADLKQPTPARLVLEGELEVAKDGFHQLVLSSHGKLSLTWNGQAALDGAPASPTRLAFGAAFLKAGWNALRLELVPEGAPRLSALLSGAQVAAPVAPAALRHTPR